MDSQGSANSMTGPASGHAEAMVKPNAPLPPQQGFQPRPQGPPPSPRNAINNGPVGAPRPPGQPLRRLDSRSSLGPPPAPGQFAQLRPYGPPRPPGVSFPPRSPQPAGQQQLPPPLNPPHPQNQRFPAHFPGIRGPAPQQGSQRPPLFLPNQQTYQQQQQLLQQQQQQQRGSNDPRFQRPEILPQNGPVRRPSQESVFTRQLSRNDSSLSLQRQHLLSSEEIKQPTRPRIVVEKMADINETGSAGNIDKPEGFLLPKKSENVARENSDNNDDDDDDVVMDGDKSPRRDSAQLMNGSKSPRTPTKFDDAGKRTPSRPGTATTIEDANKSVTRPGTSENKTAANALSRPISANIENKAAADDSTPVIFHSSRPSTAVSEHKDDDRKEEKKPASSRPPSSKEGDVERPAEDDSAKKDDSNNDKTSRPPSSASLDQDRHSLKTPTKSSDNSRSATPQSRNAEQESKTPSKSPDKSRSVTPSSGLRTEDAEQETPAVKSSSPDKSRASTPGGLQPPGDAERESRSPDKSRASTPLQTPSPNAERETTLRTPSRTPDKSRANTPAPEASRNEVEPEKPSENPHRDKSGGGGENALRANDSSSRPASALSGSPIGKAGKSPKSPRSPTPDSQNKLSVPAPGSAIASPRSPDDRVKGFDNGQQRSLSSSGSPRSPTSPKSPVERSEKGAEGEKKQTSFVEDSGAVAKKTVEIADDASSAPTETSKSAIRSAAKTSRAQTPTKLDDKAEKKSTRKKAVQNGREANATTTNGVAESPTKKSKEVDKTSTAGSPTKSPSKSAKSLPRTPDTPSSTSQDKKKVPMNKVQVGAAPSPNLKTVRSKIGSLDNASYKPGGGKVKIENRKLDFSKAQPKIAAKNEKYAPSGGDKKISQVKLQWNAKSKVGSLENATYKPGGGDKKIETVKLDFKDKAKPKVGSKDNAKHVPGGGSVKSATPPKTPQETKNDIPTQKIDIKAESKIGSLDNVKHKPGGGDKKIFNDTAYMRQTSSNVESLNGSGSQPQTPVEDDRHSAKSSTIGDNVEKLQPQPPPSTPTKTRGVTSPVSPVVTPQAVRSGLAKSPDAATPRKQLARETDPGTTLANGHATSKTPSPDVTSDARNSPKGGRSPISPRPPSSLRVRSASDRSNPGTPRKASSPSTPSGGTSSPGSPPRKSPSPRELRLPKIASSPIPQEASFAAPETHSKITLPKLIESSSYAARIAY